MASIRDFGGTDLLRVAKEIADYKGLSFEFVIDSIERAMQFIGHSKYGNCMIKVCVDRKSGIISSFREIMVVDDDNEVAASEAMDSGYSVLKLTEALSRDASATHGSVLLDPLPPIDLDYATARVAKSKIAHFIQMEERKKQYEEFKNRTGIIYGNVEQVDHGNLIVNINGNEACILRKHLIGRENFRQGEKVKAAIDYVKSSSAGTQIFLSRTNNDFLVGLFEQEIPEICDGIVKIHSIARDPGSRSKVAVYSSNKSIDPIGSCIGIRGNRIKSISDELNGEKIDVIMYSSDIGTFIVNALAISDVLKIIVHEELNQIDVVVSEHKLSLAIGRRGQNIRLVSMLVGSKVKIVTEQEDSDRRNKELREGTVRFAEALDVEEIIGQLLVTEGFGTIDDIINASVGELMGIEGFTEDIAIELQERAKNYSINNEEQKISIIDELQMDSNFLDITEISPSDLNLLYKNDVKTIQDFAGLSVDEFFEISPEATISKERFGAIIIELRKNLGWL